MSAIISINDNHLLIQKEGTLASTQGYAWLTDGQVHFDFDKARAAVRYCRLQPQQIQNRYWQQCAQTSIGANESGVRNSADLIWQHLTAIRDTHDLAQVTFVVPSHYHQDNLQLLLGIAQSSDLFVQGLVNKAVLMTQHLATANGRYLHIDLQLHQTVCSLVEVTQGIVRLADVDVLHNVSIQAIHDALLKKMQQAFIQSDRFDPLHYADTEQQLFDQLTSAAKTILLDGKVRITVNHAGRVYSIALDTAQWNGVLQPFADSLFAARQGRSPVQFLLQLNKLFNRSVPSPFVDQDVIIVDDKLMLQTDQLIADDGVDGLAYTLELPLLKLNQDVRVNTEPLTPTPNSDKAVTPTVVEHAISANDVTHLMQSGLAVPLNNASIEISNNGLLLSRSSSSNLVVMLAKQRVFILNDPPRTILQLNDRLGSNHADGVITAIQVLE